MLTQREIDLIKEEQRQRLSLLKETIIQEYLGPRYKMMPPVPPGAAKLPNPEPTQESY